MKKLILFITITVSISFSIAGQNVSDQDLLNLLNSNQTFYLYFKADLNFEVHSVDKDADISEFTLYVNDKASLVRFEKPSREKGKIILQIDNKYWIYFPKTRRSSALSPLTSLAGNASNSDVLREPDAEFYDISILKKAENNNGIAEVVFDANSRDAAYGKIVSHYDGYRKIYSEIFSRSGILLKKVEYSDHVSGSNPNVYLASYAKIIDGRNSEKFTIMKIDNIEPMDSINDSWFKPGNLGRVR